jgi:uncharacterized protein YhfF
MKMNDSAQIYLETYLDSLSAEQKSLCTSTSIECFCDNKEDADKLAELVLKGKKTATCSLKYYYDNEMDVINPTVGHLMVVTDFSGTPICIIKTVSVNLVNYCDVSAEYAFLEGEGDGSLAYWRRVHWDFFSKQCNISGFEFNEKMELYLEQFEVVYS